jgi:outer membrane protein assembly factor BamB
MEQTYRSAPAPAPVLVATIGSKVFGLDRATGRVLWEHALNAYGVACALVVQDDVVYAASMKDLACLDYRTGRVLWSSALAASGRVTLLVDGAQLFVGCGGEVECFSLGGKRLWHNPFKGKGLANVALGVPGQVAQADDAG